MSVPITERPWQRALRIDDAVEHVSVAEATEHGALPVLEVIAARCELLGVPDVTLSEVLRSCLACRVLGRPRSPFRTAHPSSLLPPLCTTRYFDGAVLTSLT